MKLPKFSRSLISKFPSAGSVPQPQSFSCVIRLSLLRQACFTPRTYSTTISEQRFAMADHPTLVRPPPLDPSKSPIENVLELTELRAFGPDVFTNTRPLWHPPGARGIYGGAVIAQCLSAAQRTVPENFTVHSMHCYFVLAGDSDISVIYYVEHVREGKSFATRTVQARQRGRCIFTTTMSFVRENSGGAKQISHAAPLPLGIDEPLKNSELHRGDGDDDGGSPFQIQRIDVLNADSDKQHEMRTRQWMRARGTISPNGGHQAHLSALAYMSDSYFIGTVSRIHRIWRFDDMADKLSKDSAAYQQLKEMVRMDGFGDDVENKAGHPEIGMMVSLDHTIYFHEPKKFRADEWMFTEMQSPWAGEGRGLVTQHIHSKDGTLVATCVQEGVVRLKQDPKPKL